MHVLHERPLCHKNHEYRKLSSERGMRITPTKGEVANRMLRCNWLLGAVTLNECAGLKKESRNLQWSYNGRSVMQADCQIYDSPVILEAGVRERRRGQQGFYIV